MVALVLFPFCFSRPPVVTMPEHSLEIQISTDQSRQFHACRERTLMPFPYESPCWRGVTGLWYHGTGWVVPGTYIGGTSTKRSGTGTKAGGTSTKPCFICYIVTKN